MGCISSKILTKSGSLQEKVNHGFPRSNLIEEIILSNSKSNGDQFLALLCSSSSTGRRAKDAEQSAPASKVDTITVADLLAGLEEEDAADTEAAAEEDERQDRDQSSSRWAPDGAAGRARSFRTVEEFDALVTQTQSSSSEHAELETPAPEEDAAVAPMAQSISSEQDEGAVTTESNASGLREATGAKRRARARQLGDLSVPPAFDFSKSGSLRDWLRGGGQIFSPGSYVTPKFGNRSSTPSEHGGSQSGEQQQRAVFDPELVAQFEQAMEQLSMDEKRVLDDILEVLQAGEKEETQRPEPKAVNNNQPVVVRTSHQIDADFYVNRKPCK